MLREDPSFTPKKKASANHNKGFAKKMACVSVAVYPNTAGMHTYPVGEEPCRFIMY